MNPAEGLMAPPENTIGLGVPRLVWLNALKNSVLNCNVVLSAIAVFFTNDKSTFARPGPRNTPLPKFPQAPAVGITNALGSNHCVCFFSNTGPENEGFNEGRSGFRVFPSPD